MILLIDYVNFVYEPAGACGYGSLALDISGGHLAGGVASLFKNGAGCGACFEVCVQIRRTMYHQIDVNCSYDYLSFFFCCR